jgi:hypothetical protein
VATPRSLAKSAIRLDAASALAYSGFAPVLTQHADAVCELDHTPSHVIATTLACACDRCRATLPRGGPTMSERAVEEGRSWTSDVVWVAFYSILVLLLMLMWVYVPA